MITKPSLTFRSFGLFEISKPEGIGASSPLLSVNIVPFAGLEVFNLANVSHEGEDSQFKTVMVGPFLSIIVISLLSKASCVPVFLLLTGVYGLIRMGKVFEMLNSGKY